MATRTQSPLSDTEISRLLSHIDPSVTVSTCRGVDEWNGPATLVRTSKGERFRLFCEPVAGGRLRKEASLLQRVHEESDVPVPAVVAIDSRGDIVSIPTLVVRDRGGLPVFDIAGLAPTNQTELFRAFGVALGELHRISFDGFGPIGTDGESVNDGEETWHAWFTARFDGLLEALGQGPFGTYEEAITDRLEAGRADFEEQFEACLAKGWYGFEGLLVDPDADTLLRSVRGFDRAIAAPAEYAFAVARWSVSERSFRSPSFAEAFEHGYGSASDVRTDTEADGRRTLYRLERLLTEIDGLGRMIEAGEIGTDEADARSGRLRDHLDRVLEHHVA